MQRSDLYIVIAYRWGSTNDHWYYLYAGKDETKALAMAESERDGRGHKYGCLVYRTDEFGELWEQHAYFAVHDEEEPTLNWRIEYFERLGHLLDDYVGGHIMVADEGETVSERDHELQEKMERQGSSYGPSFLIGFSF